jgi:hypothetical protein
MMNWNYIFFAALRFNIAIAGGVLAYHFAKSYTANKRSSKAPRLAERLGRIGLCVFFLALFGGFCSLGTSSEEDDSPVPDNSNRGAVVFMTLLLPVVLGSLEGFTTDDAPRTGPHTRSETDW